MSSRKKYQVFISSTFTDLKEERKAVTWELLKARHVPVGMEAFSATDDRGWKTITATIDDSDYYVLILAGRLGSKNDALGKSWTQLEYEYAREHGIPVLPFVREDRRITRDQLDTGESAAELERFKAIVERVGISHGAENSVSLLGCPQPASLAPSAHCSACLPPIFASQAPLRWGRLTGNVVANPRPMLT